MAGTAFAALLGWGARYDHRWVVPIAVCFALPTVWVNTPAILVGCLPLLEGGARTPRRVGSCEPRRAAPAGRRFGSGAVSGVRARRSGARSAGSEPG